MRRICTIWVVSTICVSVVCVPTHMQGQNKPEQGEKTGDAKSDPFVAVENADPLELAKLVDRLGDQAVLDRLSRDKPVEVRLAAFRSAVWMQAPESALALLVQALRGRDSVLAPASARAVLQITEKLTFDALWAREFPPAALSEVRVCLASVAESGFLRPDIVLYAAQAAKNLAEIGVP